MQATRAIVLPHQLLCAVLERSAHPIQSCRRERPALCAAVVLQHEARRRVLRCPVPYSCCGQVLVAFYERVAALPVRSKPTRQTREKKGGGGGGGGGEGGGGGGGYK